MTQSTQQARNSESGFTLVELAIVMIIIGLLIGGILKGQELINNARVSSSVTQLKGFEGAINTFNDKFSARPGDMVFAQVSARVPNCTNAPCTLNATTAGDGDNFIESVANVGNAETAFTESTMANVQLTNAGMMSGNVDVAAAAFGAGLFSDFNLGGKVKISYSTGGAFTGAVVTVPPSGHYLVAGMPVTSSAAAGAVSASAAAAIDRKLDDGLPTTGSVRAGSSGVAATDCVLVDQYNEAAGVNNCAVIYKALQ